MEKCCQPKDDYYFEKLYLDWLDTKKDLPKNIFDWYKIFPTEEGKTALKYYKLKLKTDFEDILKLKGNSSDDETFDVFYGEFLKDIIVSINKINRLLGQENLEVIHNGLINKDTLKQIPIENFYDYNLRSYGNKKTGLCPFHKESRPSFFINTEKNTWYCFAESIGGDVINFVMKLNDVDFKSALKYLNKIHLTQMY